jgi:hypothetical protein
MTQIAPSEKQKTRTSTSWTRSRLAAAMKRWGYASLVELQRDAVARPDWFWWAALDDLGITFTTPRTDYTSTTAPGRRFRDGSLAGS